MMKIYLAAPIFNPEQLAVVRLLKSVCEDYSHEVFSPYHNSQDIWQGRAPKDCTPEERAQVLEDNIKHIDWCDILLAWVGGMGGFTDPGVVWEMGYAYGQAKFTLAYIDEEMDRERMSMNLMLSGTIDSVVTHRQSLSPVLLWLMDGERAFNLVRQSFPPSVLGQEREPIV